MNRKARRSRDGRDKAKQYKDPLAPNDKVFPPEEDVSWLGRWADNGWAIRIGRKLTDKEWAGFRAEESFDKELLRYDPHKALNLLHEAFPDVELDLMYPRCNKRLASGTRNRHGLPVYMLCDQDGTEPTQVMGADGKRVTVVRCLAHVGEL